MNKKGIGLCRQTKNGAYLDAEHQTGKEGRQERRVTRKRGKKEKERESVEGEKKERRMKTKKGVGDKKKVREKDMKQLILHIFVTVLPYHAMQISMGILTLVTYK